MSSSSENEWEEWAPGQRYCICHEVYDESRAMIECDECNDWFHEDCVNIKLSELENDAEWFCPWCSHVRAWKKNNPNSTEDPPPISSDLLTRAQQSAMGRKARVQALAMKRAKMIESDNSTTTDKERKSPLKRTTSSASSSASAPSSSVLGKRPAGPVPKTATSAKKSSTRASGKSTMPSLGSNHRQQRKPVAGTGTHAMSANAIRAKVRSRFEDCFTKVPAETLLSSSWASSSTDAADAADVVDKDDLVADAAAAVARAIEVALYNYVGRSVEREYRTKAQTLNANLKDDSNPELRGRVVSGDLAPAQLVTLSSAEMASSEARAAREATLTAIHQEKAAATAELLANHESLHSVRSTHKGLVEVEKDQDAGNAPSVNDDTARNLPAVSEPTSIQAQHTTSAGTDAAIAAFREKAASVAAQLNPEDLNDIDALETVANEEGDDAGLDDDDDDDEMEDDADGLEDGLEDDRGNEEDGREEGNSLAAKADSENHLNSNSDNLQESNNNATSLDSEHGADGRDGSTHPGDQTNGEAQSPTQQPARPAGTPYSPHSPTESPPQDLVDAWDASEAGAVWSAEPDALSASDGSLWVGYLSSSGMTNAPVTARRIAGPLPSYIPRDGDFLNVVGRMRVSQLTSFLAKLTASSSRITTAWLLEPAVNPATASQAEIAVASSAYSAFNKHFDSKRRVAVLGNPAGAPTVESLYVIPSSQSESVLRTLLPLPPNHPELPQPSRHAMILVGITRRASPLSKEEVQRLVIRAKTGHKPRSNPSGTGSSSSAPQSTAPPSTGPMSAPVTPASVLPSPAAFPDSTPSASVPSQSPAPAPIISDKLQSLLSAPASDLSKLLALAKGGAPAAGPGAPGAPPPQGSSYSLPPRQPVQHNPMHPQQPPPHHQGPPPPQYGQGPRHPHHPPPPGQNGWGGGFNRHNNHHNGMPPQGPPQSGWGPPQHFNNNSNSRGPPQQHPPQQQGWGPPQHRGPPQQQGWGPPQHPQHPPPQSGWGPPQHHAPRGGPPHGGPPPPRASVPPPNRPSNAPAWMVDGNNNNNNNAQGAPPPPPQSGPAPPAPHGGWGAPANPRGNY